MIDTVISACKSLSKNFKKIIVEYQHYSDIVVFLENMKFMEIKNLNKELKQFEYKYNSKKIVENLAIVIKSVILGNLTFKNDRNFLDPGQFQDFFESYYFICSVTSYEKVKQRLLKKSLDCLENSILSYNIQDLLKLEDILFDIRETLEPHTFNKLNEKIYNNLRLSFGRADLSEVNLEFLEFNWRHQQLSEEIIKSEKMNRKYLNCLSGILRHLKINDSKLKTQITSFLRDSPMIEPIPNSYKRFTLRKYQLPSCETIKDLGSYSIHNLMKRHKIAGKSQKYFFRVYVDNHLKSILKVTRFFKLSSKEYKIFILKEKNPSLEFPKILGITYTNENIISIAKNYKRIQTESENFTSNVLRIFFERFHNFSDGIVDETLIIKSIHSLLETLKVMNANRLFVPIIFIENLALNDEKSKILFVDFHKIKTSDEFRPDSIQHSWIIEKYKDCRWIRKIGIFENELDIHIETLQSWCLAQIFKMKLELQFDYIPSNKRVNELLDYMKNGSILFQNIQQYIQENILDEKTEDCLFISNSSLSSD